VGVFANLGGTTGVKLLSLFRGKSLIVMYQEQAAIFSQNCCPDNNLEIKELVFMTDGWWRQKP